MNIANIKLSNNCQQKQTQSTTIQNRPPTPNTLPQQLALSISIELNLIPNRHQISLQPLINRIIVINLPHPPLQLPPYLLRLHHHLLDRLQHVLDQLRARLAARDVVRGDPAAHARVVQHRLQIAREPRQFQRALQHVRAREAAVRVLEGGAHQGVRLVAVEQARDVGGRAERGVVAAAEQAEAHGQGGDGRWEELAEDREVVVALPAGDEDAVKGDPRAVLGDYREPRAVVLNVVGDVCYVLVAARRT